jgi:hypothetical protein
MPFDYSRSGPNGAARSGRLAARREQMYLEEMEERAALLCRLGFDKARAKLRLRANLAWDFELNETPALAKKIDSIVDAIYARRGRAGGTPEP